MKKTINKIKKKRKQLKELPKYSNGEYKKLNKVDKKRARENIAKRKSLKKSISSLQIYLSYLICEAQEEQKSLLTPIFEGTINQYRYRARFIFTKEDLEKVKGYNLLCQKGFFSKNNILGVVKDHRLSIKFGFDNNIDPRIIGHPTNCEFMYYSKNASKSANSSLTLVELLDLISKW